MCVRGLLMLMHNDRLSDYKWIRVNYELTKAVNQIFENLQTDHILMQYLVSMTKVQLLQYVMKVQSMITLQIVTDDIDLDHLEETVKVLDLLYRVNKAKSQEEQI